MDKIVRRYELHDGNGGTLEMVENPDGGTGAILFLRTSLTDSDGLPVLDEDGIALDEEGIDWLIGWMGEASRRAVAAAKQ